MKLVKKIEYKPTTVIAEGPRQGEMAVHSLVSEYNLTLCQFEIQELVIDLSKIQDKRNTAKSLLALLAKSVEL